MIKKRTIAPVAVLLAGTCLAALLSCSSGHSSAAASLSSSRLSLQRCELPGIKGDVRCGTYEVFEDRAAKSGRTIELKIVVLKALGGKPQYRSLKNLQNGRDIKHGKIAAATFANWVSTHLSFDTARGASPRSALDSFFQNFSQDSLIESGAFLYRGK